MSKYDFEVTPGQPIQSAIDQVARAGGGRVVLLPGIHYSGTVYLKSSIELHLVTGAELCGGTTPEEYDALPESFGEYHPEHSPRALIAALDAENIAITGTGVINGNGPSFYDSAVPDGQFFYRKPPLERPRMIQLVRCRGVRLENIRLLDSPNWTCWFIENEDVKIHGVRIQGDPRMINNDGLHFFGGKRVAISDCFISTGDDALVVRSGHAWSKMTHRCEASDFVVTNCVLESACQGIRLGCTCDDWIHDCRFSNLIIRSRNVGIYLDHPKRYETVACIGNPEEIDNISFDHISIDSATKPMAVEVEESVTLKRVGRISFSNIQFTGRHPLSFFGSSTTPLEEIVLQNVSGVIVNAESALIHRHVCKLICDRLEIDLEKK